MKIRAVTIWEPYATLVACGLKRFETRGHSTNYRGPLVIHAAKRWDREREADCRRVRKFIRERLDRSELTNEQNRALFSGGFRETLGRALGVVNLRSCKQMSDGGNDAENAFGYFGAGRYGWECADARVFEKPIEETGKQGLWIPSAELAAAALELYRDNGGPGSS